MPAVERGPGGRWILSRGHGEVRALFVTWEEPLALSVAECQALIQALLYVVEGMLAEGAVTPASGMETREKEVP